MSLGEVIGDLLPSAIGVAISPVPIIAAVLMVLSADAKRIAPAFAAGWVIGLTVVTIVVALLADPAGEGSDAGASTASGIVKLLLGALFVVMAAGQWRKRPGPGEEAALPGWMAAIDQLGAGKAFGLGVLLSGVNPKNLVLAAAAGLAIAEGNLSSGDAAIAIAVFVVIGSLTVAGPVLAFFVLKDRVAGMLAEAKSWLQRENATVMAIVLLVMGFVIIGKGIGTLSR